MKRTVYLAGPYVARQTLMHYADELTTIGYTSTATWLDGSHEADDEHTATAQQRGQWALQDLRDIKAADVLVAFTSDAAGHGGGQSGGRHVETGFALALDKTVLLVGEPENVFHSLPHILVVADWHAAVIALSRDLVAVERNAPHVMDRAS